MSSPMFYNNIVPLDKKRDLNLKLKRQSTLAFAKDTNSMAVAGFEFFEASRSYPIFFIKNKEDAYIPLAILSFRKNGHELGDRWEGAYVPAYVRRYPFMLSGDGVVVMDKDAPHFQGDDGEPLFTEEGEATDMLKGIVDFLKMTDQGFRLTEEFCVEVAKKDLFKQFDGKIAVGQGSIDLGEVYVIDEQKLHENLDEKEVFEWFNKGWISWAHAHLHSIGSIGELFKRARAAADAAKAKEETAEA